MADETHAKAKIFDWKRDLELAKTILIALVMALTFRSLAYEPFHIPSGSMKSTLLVGDYIWVSKFSYGYSRYSFPFGFPLFEDRIFKEDPKRGDVIVFRPPARPRVDFIKRVIGLPGDRIQVKGGVLYINGLEVPREEVDSFTDQEPGERMRKLQRYKETLPNGVTYMVLDDMPDGPLDDTQVYIVPSGHYFMMGDNRDHSVDSRVLGEIGFIPEDHIIGQAQAIFFSTDKSAALWEVWKWPTAMRFERFFTGIH